MLTQQGDFKNDESLRKIFGEMDKNEDGKISFQEAEVFEGEGSSSLLVMYCLHLPLYENDCGIMKGEF